jgi:ABC-type multidrug transport system fused ATPase/permease subunit
MLRCACCVVLCCPRGIILEQGTHQELLAIPNGGYARLVAAQMKTGGPAAGQ